MPRKTLTDSLTDSLSVVRRLLGGNFPDNDFLEDLKVNPEPELTNPKYWLTVADKHDLDREQLCEVLCRELHDLVQLLIHLEELSSPPLEILYHLESLKEKVQQAEYELNEAKYAARQERARRVEIQYWVNGGLLYHAFTKKVPDGVNPRVREKLQRWCPDYRKEILRAARLSEEDQGSS